MNRPVLLTDPRPLAALPADARLGIDTEFHTERRYHPELHLIQIRADLPGLPTWILDPHDDGAIRACAPELVRRPWLTHAGEHDLPLLQRALGGVSTDVLDTQIAAGLVTPRWPTGLARLCADWLGQDLDKGETLSDWSRRPLSPAQLAYAAADVEVLHGLWARIEARAVQFGRLELVRAACAEAAEQALAGPVDEDVWLGIPGHATLAPRQRGVLQELALWREGVARAEDQPAHGILANRILLDLAKRGPLTRETLLAGRRAPKAILARHADALLDRITRASARPPAAWPEVVAPGTAASARVAWLRAWAESAALARNWSARLVLPERLASQIALGQGAARGWRAVLLADILDPEAADPLRWPDGAGRRTG